MDEVYESLELIDDQENARFLLLVNEQKAFVSYRKMRQQIVLIHTETEDALKGKGAAKALIEKTLRSIEEQQLMVLPFCPFVMRYIRSHPEWKRVVDPRFKGYDQI